ncbi:putative multidrug ABC transporter ATP-binding protein YbhF [bioreactor metagenome]|uniref:Abc transporter n=2 Tax=root TaxID=1 RepID=A0A1W1IJ57_9LACT|nr:ABC transporter ATP-binding protein [Trichococcus pasteurii]SFE99986.1 ABC-2 type transport system ATP-binding protein [Trichococcus pasteurii]SLM53114.1 abc transporter [Trichococcus pasteurii]SSB93995.1 abc transporter [Trichococcus pasteurii]
MHAIEVQHVSKKFKQQRVLEDIHFTIEEGEIVGIIGPSGTGKTTLIKLMLGMESLDTGQTKIYDQLMPNFSVLGKVGYMAQADALYEELTGKENLAFFGKLYGLKKDVLQQRQAYVAQVTNLTKDLSKRVSNYSGGMKRRLSLAIALLHNPDILILDEPTVGVDPILRQSIWQELNGIRDQGKTIVVTTHAMDEAGRCDKLILLNHGRLIALGTAAEMMGQFNVDTIEEVFLAAGGAEE